ncbi:prolipoprotein diacylglyceryl transferase [Patescibacteria group bacterium]|nr:prolipoprotein diacylglyceryl transferase [Patescibacteria group bacterium]
MYGLLISIGGILAFLISEKAAKKQRLDLGIFYPTVNFTIIGGVVGARIWHVIDYWWFYSQNFRQIFEIWKGGLGIFGGLIGGSFIIILTLFLKGEHKRIWLWLDTFVLGLPLAQAMGRWGNYFNQEIYGIETSLPWGILIKGQKHHPLFLYESILDLCLFFVLQKMWKKQEEPEADKKKNGLKEGTVFATYTFGYMFIRILLQPLRMH